MQRLAIVVLFGVASCQPGPHELTDFERSAVTAEIEKEAQEFLDAMLARDIERWSSLLRRDGFEMLINGNLRESYEEVRRSRSRKLESWAKAEGAWDGARVRVLSPNAAVFRGYAHATIEMTSGETIHFPKNFFGFPILNDTDSIMPVGSDMVYIEIPNLNTTGSGELSTKR